MKTVITTCWKIVYVAQPEFRTENPPVPAVPKVMQNASNSGIRPSTRIRSCRTVRKMYIL